MIGPEFRPFDLDLFRGPFHLSKGSFGPVALHFAELVFETREIIVILLGLDVAAIAGRLIARMILADRIDGAYGVDRRSGSAARPVRAITADTGPPFVRSPDLEGLKCHR